MMQQPEVSVIIPAYRCSDTIIASVESALNQGIPLEIIVVDDDPESPVLPVLAQYIDSGAVRYVCNDRNRGAAESRNRGVSLAKAPYVAFLDADDQWCSEKLKKQLAALAASGASLCCTGRELMTPDGTPTGKCIGIKETISYRELLKHNSINCSSVVLPRKIALEFPMEHADDSHEDYILWLKILNKYGNARGIDEPLLRYRVSNSGKSGSKLHSAGMTFRVYRYMGFGICKSFLCFCSYALHGVKKYLFTKKKANDLP